jgi:malate permease and related proteins
MIQLDRLGWLYLSLTVWVGLGVILGRKLPARIPQQLGQFLFWVGVPLSIIAFLRQANLSAAIWSAPVTAWVAILLGLLAAKLAWSGLQFSQVRRVGQVERRHTQDSTKGSTEGSFLLSAMVGNTGYLGYPVVLALTNSAYFGWAVFYDILGSALGSYGLGVMLAAYFGNTGAIDEPIDGPIDRPTGPNHRPTSVRLSQILQALFYNPALWSFGIGLGLRTWTFSDPVEQGLRGAAWAVVALSLLLIGMRLSQCQIRAGEKLRQAAISLSIKMLLVPLLVGLGLPYFGIDSEIRLVLVLQAGMPPAFATLVIAEAYNLDRQLTVVTLALGAVTLLLLLPLWLYLF